MEIKSSLLNDEDFSGVKDSIIAASEVDNKEKFRVKLVEYINDSADNNHDMFFYDMLEFLRFLKPGSDSIAYTTPDKLIFMNAPDDKIGEKIRQWDFIYCHECLHQLWDTFAVGDKIKQEGIEYNHKLLNIASDCVINDYLRSIRKKEAPEIGIMPEVLKEKFDIDYDRRTDTQFTLYLKLLEHKNDVEDDKDLDDMMDQMDGDGQDNDSSDSQGNSSQGSGKGKKSDKQNSDSANSGDSESDEQDGSEETKDGSGKGSKDKNDDAKDGEGDSSEKGEKSKGKDGKDKSESDSDEDSSENGGKGKGKGSSGEDIYTNSNAKKAEAIIEKYRNKISGDFGQFIKKCKASFDMSRSGLATEVHKGGSSWNQLLSQYTNAFVKKKVFQKKRQYESTYSRIKRGSGFVEFGKPIDPGRKIKDQKMTINVAFYIDRSGSMSSCINDVFDACYTIAESLKRQFGKEKVVEDVTFKLFAFNDQMKEIKFGNRASASGGTMAFASILDFMSKNTKNYLVNIIITDAEFDIDKDKISTFIKDIDGMVSFITNNDNPEVKSLSKKFQNQLYYILADRNFSIK